jgi:hypothetical protein
VPPQAWGQAGAKLGQDQQQRGQDDGQQIRWLASGQGNPGPHELVEPENQGHKRQAHGQRMVKETARTAPAPTGKMGVHTILLFLRTRARDRYGDASMNLYWGLNTIPELQGLTKDQQRHLWKTALQAGRQVPRIQTAKLIMFTMILIALLIPHLLLVMAWGGFRGLVSAWIFRQVSIPALRPLLAMQRRALEPNPAHDETYYVPPAF